MRTLSVNVVGYVDWILAGVESMFVHRFARVASIFIIDSVIFFFLRSSSDIVNLIVTMDMQYPYIGHVASQMTRTSRTLICSSILYIFIYHSSFGWYFIEQISDTSRILMIFSINLTKKFNLDFI